MTSSSHLMISLSVILHFILPFGNCKTTQANIDSLVTTIETAFSGLSNFLNADLLSANFVNLSATSVNDSVAINILSNSKTDTEQLITKANGVINQIQSNLTSKYSHYESPILYPNCSVKVITYFQTKSITNFTYEKIDDCTFQTLPFTPDPFLDNIPTCRNRTTTHIPTSLYEYSIEAQIFANWTQDLDQLFRVTKDDSQLKWKYFCSSSGFERIYPGIRWKIQKTDSFINNSLVDFYDCRFEIFYLQSTAYPKKMFIMVDQSGSMEGRSVIMTLKIVKEILNTLTENDFFNIGLFGMNLTFVDRNVTKFLIQATDKNKWFLLNQLNQTLDPANKTNLNLCLTEVFNVLRKDKNNQTGNIIYNYLVMFITDGSLSLVDNFMQNDIDARIFTHITQQGASDRFSINKIACSNRGYSAESQTLSDVVRNVLTYLKVVSRKNAIIQNIFNIWTGVHQIQIKASETSDFPGFSAQTTITSTSKVFSTTFPSSTATKSPTVFAILQSPEFQFFREKPIPLYVSTAAAVYDQSPKTINSNVGNILGSVGIDIYVNEFVKTAPFWKIGVNAYLFGITSNGFLIFHPKFRPQYKNSMKIFYRNVDISEVEISSNLTIAEINGDQTIQPPNTASLRQEMLDNNAVKQFSTSLVTFQILDSFITGFKVKRNYFMAGISGTPYKFGLAIPTNQMVPVYANNTFTVLTLSVFQNLFGINFATFNQQCGVINLSENQSGIVIKDYEFCFMTPDIATLQMLSPLCTLINVFVNSTLLTQCTFNNSDKLAFLNNVYTEITNSSSFNISWSSLNGKNFSVQQIFSMLHFGLIRYYNYENLYYQNFIKNHSAGIDDSLYQETILTAQYFQNNRILVATSLPNQVFMNVNNWNSLVFTISTPLVNNGIYIGVVGVQAKFDFYQSLLNKSLICANSSVTECYIITASGVILFNNINLTFNGLSLKDINCAIMESFVNNNIYNTQYFYDMQALCNILSQPTSFGKRLINPISELIGHLIWVIGQLFLLIQNFSLTTLMWGFSSFEENPFYNVSSVENSRPCYLKIPAYTVTPSNVRSNGNVSNCLGCNQNFYIRSINNTNLFLVVVEKSVPNCKCVCSSAFGKRDELTRNISKPLANPYQVNPNFYSNFANFSKIENSSVCSHSFRSNSASATLISSTLIVLAAIH